MSFGKMNGLMLGAGFLLGSVGLKVLTSPQAKNCYVQGVAKGLQAKNFYEDVIEQAKAEVDDIVAEANYINIKAAEEKAVETSDEEVVEEAGEEPSEALAE